jgi:hypothetical protein
MQENTRSLEFGICSLHGFLFVLLSPKFFPSNPAPFDSSSFSFFARKRSDYFLSVMIAEFKAGLCTIYERTQAALLWPARGPYLRLAC